MPCPYQNYDDWTCSGAFRDSTVEAITTTFFISGDWQLVGATKRLGELVVVEGGDEPLIRIVVEPQK